MPTRSIEATAVLIPRPASAAFAATILALGVVGLARGELTQLWSGVPPTFPARAALAYVCASVAAIAGLALLWRRSALAASRTLVVAFAIWMALFRLPALVGAWTSTGAWWGIGETAVLLAAALALMVSYADGRADERWLRAARLAFGLGLIPFGVAHFTYLARTVSMVPAWLPGHLAIAVLTGSAFIAAGVAVIVGVWARVAALLVTVEMGLFTLLVWAPVMAGHPTPSDRAEFATSWLLTTAAWVVADSYLRAPRLVPEPAVAPSTA